jgi:hypothetical protein
MKNNEISPWFDSKQIETWVGQPDNGVDEITGGRAKLIVLHQCGENKEWLVDQLKFMIDLIENPELEDSMAC